MFAADPPAIVQPSEEDSSGIIEVVATRPGQAQKIDRRTYRVKQNAQSAQFNAIELMRGLPAVTITPDDQILLLGASGVTFLVDERPVRGDPILYLRTLHGSDIERIEVMTNPSAQYGSGTGGIINIVLRKQRDDGVTGSGNVELSSIGAVEGSATIKKKSGKLSYELQVQGAAGRMDWWTHAKLRSVQQFEGGPSTINREEGGGHTSRFNASVTGKVSYELSPRTTLGASSFAGYGTNPTRSHADFIAVTPDFESFSERARSDFEVSWVGAELTYDRKGKKDGESLKGSLGLFGNPIVRSPAHSEFGEGRTFSSLLDRSTRYSYAKLDWIHHPGKDEILSIGGHAGNSKSDRVYSFASNDPLRFGPDFEDSYDFKETTLSGYATFQKMFGKWTVMPGLRYEGIWRTISSPGRPAGGYDRSNLSPTLHIERPLTKTVNMTLSYRKSFDAPDPSKVAPFPTISGPLAIEIGNPDLREQVTDAYELNLHYSRKSLEVGLIVYNRITDRLWSNVYSVTDEGLNAVTTFNIGKRTDRGAEIDISTPLLKRVKGNASINLFSSRVPIFPASAGLYDNTFRYTGNATVEWQGKPDGKRPGDVAQIQLNYIGPYREYQFRDPSYYSLSFAYTHNISSTFSVTANLSGIGTMTNRHRLTAPLIQEDYARRESPEFKFKLVKTLGKPN